MPNRRKNQLDDAVKGAEVTRDALSLSEAKTLFLKDIRLLSQETKRWHRENLTALEKVLAAQNIEVKDVCQLNVKMLKEHFVFYMVEDMGLKANTVNGRVRSARALIKFLHKEGYISSDFGADVPLVKGEKVIIETFSEDQIEALLRQPDRQTFTGLRDYTLMLLLIETGVRVSEVIKIDLVDVHMKDGEVLIHGKGAKQRFVPFQAKFRRALQHYLEVRGAAPSDAVFVTVQGERISKRYVQELIQTYGDKARLRGVRVSPHTFRHTMAKFYILAGGDIFSLQCILGHSTLDMVRRYVELFSTDVRMQHRKFSFLETHLI